MENLQTHAFFGKEVLPFLAGIYPQLYVPPAEDALETWRGIVLSGEDAPGHSLAHFIMNPADSSVIEETPAGPVRSVTLYERKDFETFLQIMAHRCVPVSIPPTQGASLLDGIVNWEKIRAHENEFLFSQRAEGNPDPDWNEEFRRFTSEKTNYTDAILILSAGPYSAVPGTEFGIEESQWRQDSVTIRKYHELNHFICRRLWPEKISAVWDELVADAIGLYAAYGKYDIPMAERFLGINDGRYTGGRLENYVEEEDPVQRQKQLDRLAQKIHPVLCTFADVIQAGAGIEPFAMIPLLEDLFQGDIET